MKGPLNCTLSELSTFLRVLEEGFLPTSCLDTTPSAPSKSIAIASKSYQHGKKTVSFHGFPSLVISKISTGDRGEGWSRLFQSGLRVSDLATLEKCSGLKTQKANSFLKHCTLLAKYDRYTSSWRTLQPLLLERLGESLESWPEWAMTQGVELWALPNLDLTTKEKGSGWLRTPCASDGKKWYVSGLKACDRLNSGKQPMLIHQLVEYHGLKKGWASPEFWELIMGWPIGWTDLSPVEMDKFQSWLRSHGQF